MDKNKFWKGALVPACRRLESDVIGNFMSPASNYLLFSYSPMFLS